MRTVELSATFMAAMHTLDINQVRRTQMYKVMSAVPGWTDEVIYHMFDELRQTRDADPENWAVVTQGTLEHAAVEQKMNDGEPVSFKDEVSESIGMEQFKLDNDNPRGGSRKND